MSILKKGEVRRCRVCGVVGGQFKGFYCISCFRETQAIRRKERYNDYYKNFKSYKASHPEPVKPEQSVDEIALICEKEGITYGQYVARQYLEKERRKNGNG